MDSPDGLFISNLGLAEPHTILQVTVKLFNLPPVQVGLDRVFGFHLEIGGHQEGTLVVTAAFPLSESQSRI